MTTEKDKLNAEYEKFKDLFRHNNNEGIYQTLSEHPEIINYLDRNERAGVLEGVIRLSNEKIKNLEVNLKKAKELNDAIIR